MESSCLRSGRSPRGRGKRKIRSCRAPDQGSIPAWAGEARQMARRARRDQVDPRVGGGSRRSMRWQASRPGRSPRGRGKRCTARRQVGRGRSIPAWAGEAVGNLNIGFGPEVDPRVGGGSTKVMMLAMLSRGRSPRGRGKLPETRVSFINIGSIPAWAGEALPAQQRRCESRVDPRVGGGSCSDCHSTGMLKGRSPRGRGKRSGTRLGGARAGSIPAWAGEANCGAR